MGLATVANSASGAVLAMQVTAMNRTAASVMQGRHGRFFYMNSIMSQAMLTSEIAFLTLKVAGFAVSFFTSLAMQMSIVVSSLYLLYSLKHMPEISQIRLQDFFKELNGFMQVANIVSALALIYIGSPAIGGVILAVMALGVLDSKQIMPERMRCMWHKLQAYAAFLTPLAVQSLVARIFTSLPLIIKLYDWWEVKSLEKTKAPLSPKKEEILKTLVLPDGQNDVLEVNASYARHLPKIRLLVPKSDLLKTRERFLRIFDDIDEKTWQKFEVMIRNKLLKGTTPMAAFLSFRFGQNPPADARAVVERASLADMVAFLKDTLMFERDDSCFPGKRGIVDSVVNKCIIGELDNYQMLQTSLANIAFWYLDKKPEIKAFMIAHLALNGGHYCGTKLSDVIIEENERIFFDEGADSAGQKLLPHEKMERKVYGLLLEMLRRKPQQLYSQVQTFYRGSWLSSYGEFEDNDHRFDEVEALGFSRREETSLLSCVRAK